MILALHFIHTAAVLSPPCANVRDYSLQMAIKFYYYYYLNECIWSVISVIW